MSAYEIDNSWNALLQPGRATSFFLGDPASLSTVAGPSYDAPTAWWLAELSRLIYVQEADEVGAAVGLRDRAAHLAEAGAEEIRFFSTGGTQAFLVRLPSVDRSASCALVFRGTHDLRDWLTNLNVAPSAWPDGGLVHRGFVDALDQVWADISATLDRDIETNDTVVYAGHSLGGALATLAAARRAPAALYTFGAPRVGDAAFNASLADVPVHRVVNHRDLVTRVPAPGSLLRFEHPGKEHVLSADGDRLVDPPAAPWEARLRATMTQLLDDALHRPVHHPPTALADHAPINYVARLHRLRRISGGA